jgi:hypothetical protein
MNIFRRPTLAVLLLPMLALACAGGADNEASAPESGGAMSENVAYVDVAATAKQEAARAGQPVTPADTVSSGALPARQMIIRNGTATVRVEELGPAVARVRRLAEQLGGYVANASMTTGVDEEKSATMELKIPAARFDQALAGLSPVGTLEEQRVTAEDVGEEYTDVSARMANARRLEERLLQLLATRTGKLEDVLTVERELARVRGEIEAAEGRLRYLRTRVSLSTLTVTLHEGGYPGANPIVRSFRDAWSNFVGFVAGLVAVLGWLIPLLIVLAILWRFARWLFLRAAPAGRPWWQRPDAPPPPRHPGTPPSDAPPPAA